MDDRKTRMDRINTRIRNNPVMAVLIIFGTIVIALSTFTDAAKNLAGIVKSETRANINGDWTAEVTYDWSNKTFNELFTFKGEGKELLGTASIFRRRGGIVEGTIKKGKIEFVTHTKEILDDENNPKEVTHHFRGTFSNDQITFVLQSEGGYSTHTPIEFTANRVLSRSFDLTK